jgi:hypothetical protein
VVTTAAKFDVRFSTTARQDKRVRAAIEAIPDDGWQSIPYWLSTPEVSGADIAETRFTVFAGDKRHARQVRLVVPSGPATPGSQLALFSAWDYHAFVTDLPLAELEADHRRYGIVEQTIAGLKSAGLKHLPSGKIHGQRGLARPDRTSADDGHTTVVIMPLTSKNAVSADQGRVTTTSLTAGLGPVSRSGR